MKKAFFATIIGILFVLILSAVAMADTLTLPASLKEISDEAFMGDTSLDEVVLNEGITTISSKAFANSSIKRIYLPSSLENIASDAFQGCAGLVGYGPDDTPASRFFDAHDGLMFEREEPLTYPESSHPYENNTDQTWTFTYPSAAEYLSIHFSTETETETNYDYIYIIDSLGKTMSFSGSDLAGRTVTMKGSSFTIRLTSDSSSTGFGFAIDDIHETDGQTSIIIDSGSCGAEGDNITWTLDDKGLLMISGSGNMAQFSWNNDPYNRGDIKSVIIEEGITGISTTNFMNCHNLSELYLPSSITQISEDGYYYSLSSDISSITVSEDNNMFSSQDGVLYNKDKTCLLFYPAQKSDETYCIPETVTRIYPGAFEYCNSLKSIVIPSGVREIEHMTFYGCNNLANVVLPEELISIELNAFGFCTSLTTINIPSNVYSVSADAFLCSGISYFSVSDNNPYYSVQDGILFDKSKTELVCFPPCMNLTSYQVPGSVTSIAEYAFNNNQFIVNVVLPFGLTWIGDDAFYCCGSLENINIPESVFSIGYWAFAYCESLTGSITIPYGVTSIEPMLFYDCHNLTNIIIPDTVTSIGYDAFNGCTNLTSIAIPASVTSIDASAFNNHDANLVIYGEAGSCAEFYASDNNIAFSLNQQNETQAEDFTYEKLSDGTYELSRYLGTEIDIIIPLNAPNGGIISRIGDRAFEGEDKIISINIPDSVTYIGDAAFNGCCSLNSITISNSVTYIGSSAFFNCYDLTTIDIPDSVTNIGSFAFYNCYSLETIDIPDGITNIETCTFAGCGNMVSVNIPESVMSISRSAFYDCNELRSISIPESVTSIGERAFYHCENLKNINIPDNVTSIGAEAFSYCASLTQISIPSGITTISERIFYHCNGLTTIDLPDSISDIGDYAFFGCESLNSISMPNNISSIGIKVFRDNTILYVAKESTTGSTLINGGYINIQYNDEEWLSSPIADFEFSDNRDGTYSITGYIGNDTEIIIPKRNNNGYIVTKIDYEAFRDCTSLTSICIPDSVTVLFYSAFSGCTGLTSITIPASVTYIGNSAFNCCSSLNSIFIPSSVTIIDDNAFLQCTSLTNFDVSNDNPNYSSSDGVLLNKDKTELISYPQGKSGNIAIPNGITTIHSWAFRDCSNLTSISIPDSITFIGGSAFDDCPATRYATAGSVSAKALGKAGYSFRDSQYPKIDLRYYYNDEDLADFSVIDADQDIETVVFPDGLTNVGAYAFYYCKQLKNITIPNSVVSLGYYAFYDSGLTSIYLPDNIISCSSFFSNETKVYVQQGSITEQTLLSENYRNYLYKDWDSSSVDDFIFEWADNGDAIVKEYKGSDISVVIPQLDKFGRKVVSIGKEAFSYCETIQSVQIPPSVDYIGYGAFSRCSNLTSINLHDGITRIGDFAFRGCGFTEIYISRNIYSIGYFALSCDPLENIFVSPDNPYFSSVDGVLYDKNVTYLLWCPAKKESVIVPNGVTSIDRGALSDCIGLNDIFIPNSVTYIEYDSFEECNNLTIYGISGSYAETYANENNIPFSTDPMPGMETEPETVTVSGTVRTESGEPISGVMIYLYNTITEEIDAQAISDTEGRWITIGLKIGKEYDIECYSSMFSFDAIHFTVETNYTEKNIVAKNTGNYAIADTIVMRFDNETMSQVISIQSNSSWNVEAKDSWIILSKTAGTGNDSLTVQTTENIGKFRAGEVTLSVDGRSTTIYIFQTGILSTKLDDPSITTPAEEGITVPFGNISVIWDEVPYADHYVISLRDLTTDELLIYHSTEAVSSDNGTVLSSDYFFDGRDYRLAVAAVPKGVDSTDPIVAWSERVIHVSAEDSPDTATLSGMVYGQQVVPAGNDSEEETIQEFVYDQAIIIITLVSDAQEEIVGILRSDDAGKWELEGLTVGNSYRLYVYDENSTIAEHLDEGYPEIAEQLNPEDIYCEIQAKGGMNDTGKQYLNLSDDDEIVEIRQQLYANTIINMNHGLFAEYFQSKRQYTATSKRWELVANTVDFSWKAGRNGQDGTEYDILKTTDYNGNGSGSDVRYVKKDKFTVRFTGYLIVPETAKYDLRLTGNGWVIVSLDDLNGRTITKDDGGYFQGNNQKAKITVYLRAGCAYPITLEYYNHDKNPNCKLEWKKSNESDAAYSIIPNDYLIHDTSNRISVKNRAMETYDNLKMVDAQIQEVPNKIVQNMAMGQFDKAFVDPFFGNLDSNIYSSYLDKAVDSVKNTVIKKFLDGGFSLLTKKVLNPQMTAEQVKNELLGGLEDYLKDPQGKIDATIKAKIERIRENWDVEVVDGTVDLTGFYHWLYEFLPTEYMEIASQITIYNGGTTPDIIYIDMSSELADGENLESMARQVKSQYKSIRNVYDFFSENWELVKEYKDPNRLRSYIHLLYMEDQNMAIRDFWELLILSQYHIVFTNTNDQSQFIKLLDVAGNWHLTEFIAGYSPDGNTSLVLLYKQLLLNTLNYASKDIFDFL